MLKHVLTSFKAYGLSFRMMSDLRLWSFFMIPMLISILTAIGLGVAAYNLSDNIGVYIGKIWPWEWGSQTFLTIGSVLGGIVVLSLGLILYKHIVMALSAPFMSAVSEKIEAHMLGIDRKHLHVSSSFLTLLWRGIRINVRNLVRELVVTIPLLLIGLVPLFTPITTTLIFIVQGYFAGFGNMDYTLERHYTYRESVLFVKSNRGLALGNGIGFMLILMIPVVGFIIVLPLAVTAASISTIEKINKSMQA
ncbi:EI24 domain-containing protein [Flavobacteriaceae bacterium F08102]|nr:EI24 domain-containing protein [Flavobacteriaceae bacterium F08102]